MLLAMDFQRQARLCPRLAEDCEDPRLVDRFRSMALTCWQRQKTLKTYEQPFRGAVRLAMSARMTKAREGAV
jgi:hypothetical protein